MSIKRMFRNSKAISPILATLLLVVIAVAAIVVTYAWITTYMGNTTQQAGFMPYKANVAFASNTTITVDIGNSGTSSGQIAAIYIGTSASALATQPNSAINPDLPKAVDAGDIESFVVTYTYVPGTIYYFKVVPSSGAALSFSETA